MKSLAGKDVPEPQGLVSGSRHYRLTVWRHGQVQNSEGVPGERGELCQGGVPPYDDLILTVAVRAHQLVHVLRPHQVADLASSVHGVQSRVRGGVPETNAPVGRSASRGQETVLVGRPSDGLDRCRVLDKPEPGREA